LLLASEWVSYEDEVKARRKWGQQAGKEQPPLGTHTHTHTHTCTHTCTHTHTHTPTHKHTQKHRHRCS